MGRIWRARIDPARSEEYRSFAATHSIPMFESHDGFVGVIFGERENERLVITLWDHAEAVEALNSSARYKETVAQIESEGFIMGAQSIDTFEIPSMRIDSQR
jgi:heme-degrading monooxygenase HmoA